MVANNVFDDWASDTAPSIPQGRTGEHRVLMGGFCFTENGICVDVSAVESEAMSHPPIGPYHSADAP